MHASTWFFHRCTRVVLPAATLALMWLATPAASQAQTVTAVMHAPLRAVDPVINTAYIVRNYAYMVYDTLLALDSHGNVQPQMASWSVSEDGKTYTFTLREGLQWHDGTAVTAQDCIASIARWSQVDKMGQVMAASLTDMKPVNAHTFTMTFAAPSDFVLQALSRPSGVAPFMFPKAVAQTPINQAITSTTGSGPFVFDASQYKPGVQAVFHKFAGYVPRAEPADGLAGGKRVQVDTVRWVSMPDPMTAVSALMGAEIDFIEQLPQDLLPLVESSPDIKLSSYKKQGVQNLVRMNFLQPPFNDLKIRQAALLALGQKEVLDAQTGNPDAYTICPAVFSCEGSYADSYGADKLLEPQPEKAKALLAQTGYDGTPVYLLSPTDNIKIAPIGPVVAQQLRKAGFTVNLVSTDWASVIARRASKAAPADGGWNMFATTNVVSDANSPVGFIGITASGDTAWIGWPDVPAIEQARMQFAASHNAEEKKALAHTLQKLVIDHVVMVPMGETLLKTAARTNIDIGIDAEAPVFWNFTKKGR